MLKRRRRDAALTLVVAGILAATLFPAGGGRRPVDFSLYAGPGAVADGLLNVALFLPLGLALAWRYPRKPWVILLGGALSLLLETAQIYVPGRDPSLSDLLSNSLGTAIGVGLFRAMPVLQRAGQRHRRRMGSIGCATTIALLVFGALLLRPDLPGGDYWVRWGTALQVTTDFDGVVHDAWIGMLRLQQGSVREGYARNARAAFLGGLPLAADARVFRRPAGLAGVLGVSQDPYEVMTLGLDRDAAVLSFATRASTWGFNAPDLRFEGALSGLSWPLEVQLRAWRQHSSFCIRANTRTRCGLGFTLGDAWATLWYPKDMPARARAVFAAIWLGLLVLPGAGWLRWHRERAVLAAVVCGVLLLLPPAMGLRPSPVWQYLGALAGIWGAALLPVHRGWIPGRRRAAPHSARCAGT